MGKSALADEKRQVQCRRARPVRSGFMQNPIALAGATDPSQIVQSGRFKVVRRRRELLADGRLIDLGGRAFDALVALIDARERVLSKDDLMRRVWPDQVVEENDLQAQISALRKAFGAERTGSPLVGADRSDRLALAQGEQALQHETGDLVLAQERHSRPAFGAGTRPRPAPSAAYR